MMQIANLTLDSFQPGTLPTETPRPRKRQRKVLSCEACHKQKVRCNRQQPCQRCVAGNRADACTYQVLAQGQSSRQSSELALPSPIQSSIGQASPSTSEVTSATSTVTKQSIVACWSNDKARFSGLTHWAQLCFQFEEAAPYIRGNARDISVLASRLKAYGKTSYLPKPSRAFPFSDSTTRPVLLTQSKLSFLPSKELTEQLVENYLQTWEVTHPLLVHDDFQREFYDFWQGPEDVPDAWLAQLYMMLALSAYSGSDIPLKDVPGGYVGLAERCFDGAELVFISRGRFISKPDLHVLRTLIMISLAKKMNLMHGDDEENSWVFMGTVSRVAMSMNLHINAAAFETMPKAEAQARERVWNTLLIQDTASAIEAGRPQLIRPSDINKGSISSAIKCSYQGLLADALPTLFFCTNRLNSPNPSVSDQEVTIYDARIKELLTKAQSLLPFQRHMLEVLLRRCLCSLHQARASSPLRAGSSLAEVSTRAIHEAAFAILKTQKSLMERPRYHWLADFLSGDFGVTGAYLAIGLRQGTFDDDITSPYSSHAAWCALKTNSQFFKDNVLRSKQYYKIYRGYTVLIYALEALEKGQSIREAVIRAAMEVADYMEAILGEQCAMFEPSFEAFELFPEQSVQQMPNLMTPPRYDEVTLNFDGVNFEFDNFVNNFIF